MENIYLKVWFEASLIAGLQWSMTLFQVPYYDLNINGQQNFEEMTLPKHRFCKN